MPVINVNGNLVRFDDDLTDDQISAEIEKNPTLFDPNYKAPKPSTLDRMIGFAKSIDPVRIPKTIAEQAEESDGENVAAKQIKGAPVRQSYYNKVLLDQTDFSGRNKNNAHIDYADEEKRPVYSKSDEGAIIPGEKPRLRQTTHYRTESGNVAPADKPETPASFYYPEDKGAITPRRKPDDGILSRINAAAKNDLSGQEQQRELEGLRTDENVPEGGFVASAKPMAGQIIRGAGRVASDYFGADKDNALMEYGAELIRNDPVAIRSLNDIKDRPFLAFKEASGNMVPSFGAMMGTAIVGQGIISAAPLAGPAAPVVAAVGAAVKWLGPAAIAALPSYSGIRDKQIFNDPRNEEDAKSKAIAALGAAAVGTIEVAFGPQNWAITMLTKEGRVALARKLAATTPAGAFLKGTLLGGLQEGGEELAQNPIEQLASYDNPLTKENLEDTAFGGAMGFLGGVAPGGVTNTLNFLNQQAQSKADRINAERVKLGLSKIESAKTVDEAISAAQEVNSQNVTKDDVLRTEDPNLADIERLTGLKPSEAIDEINAQKETVASNPKSFTIIDKNTGKKLFDTDEKNMVDAIDTSRYEAIPTDEYNKRSSKEKSARDTEIVLPDNTSLKAQWDIVDADSVKASLKEGQSQPRDRTRAVSNLQIQSIANNPDYRRLSDSPVIDVGAPVLSNDGQIVGGNGRFEALSRAYDQQTAQDYLDQLRNDAARKGLDPSVIDSMNKPILVRRITEPFDTRKLAIASNSGTSAPYSARENAKIDAERIGDISNIDITDSGDIALTPRNMQIIRDSMKGYTAAEQSSFVDSNGNLSQEGARRFINAILYNAYGDSDTLTRLIESTDNDMRNVAGALMRVAGDVAKVRQEIKQGAIPKELDITDDLIGAVEKIAQLRSQNIPVQEYLSQQDIFGNGLSDDAKQIVTALHDNIRSQNKIAQFIRDVYDGISRVNIATGDMLGNQIPSKGDVIQNAKPAKAEQGKVFSKQASNVTTESGQESTANAGHKESGGETAKVKPLLSKKTDGKNLYVAHNLTAENIRHANEIGGLAAPSLAIAKTDHEFSGYGEITLIATPDILESPKVRTFDADAYSPRHPRITYEINRSKLDQFNENLGDIKNLDKPRLDDLEESNGLESLETNPAVQYAWLRDKGKAPAIKPLKIDRTLFEIAKKLKEENIKHDFQIKDNQKIQNLIDKYVEKRIDELSHVRDFYSEEDITDLRKLYRREAFNIAKRYNEKGGKDTSQFEHDITKKLRDKKLSTEFQKYVYDKFENLVKDKKIFKGFTYSGKRKYVPYNMDNILKEMTATLRAGEGFNYGPGNIRAAFSKEFKSINQIQSARDQIVSSKDMEQLKDQSRDKVMNAVDELRPYYKYDSDSFRYIDDATSAIAEGPKGWNEAFKITPESRKIITDLVDYLVTLPTEYFEAKAQRAVQLNEFNAAVVPKKTPQDVIESLKDAGLDIKYYKEGDNESRRKAVADIAAKNDALFSKSQKQQTSLTKADIQPLADKYNKKLTYGKIIVLNNENELPGGTIQLNQTAWHGSPHDHDKFSTSKIGTGEGNQAYGHGLYFASSKDVAEFYKDNIKDMQKIKELNDEMSALVKIMNKYETSYRKYSSHEGYDAAKKYDAIMDERNALVAQKGKLYEVELKPSEDEYLLWDKPLSEQSEKVKSALGGQLESLNTKTKRIGSMLYASTNGKIGAEIPGGMSGQGLYSVLKMELGSDKKASEYLHSIGIRGIKYLDGTSRGKGEGSYNYVIFNDSDVDIKAKYSKNSGLVEGAYVGDSKVYIIADAFDNMNRVDQVIQHELSHLASEELLDSKEYKTAIRSVNLLDKSGNKTIRDIAKIVDKRQPGLDADTRAKEILAMSVETGKYKNISALRRVVADVVRAFKAMLRRLGVKLSIVEKMSEQEVFATMRNAMDMLYSERNAKQSGQSESLKSEKEQIPETLNIDGISRPTRNSNGQLIHPTEEGIRNFWKWLGDGYFLDPNGKPYVFYHQTSNNAAASIYEDGFRTDLPRARESDPRVPDGVFLKPNNNNIGVGATEEKDIAQIPLYTNIKNPFIVQSAENMSTSLGDKTYSELVDTYEDTDKKLAEEFDKRWAEKTSNREAFKTFADEYFPRAKETLADIAGRARERLTEVLQEKGYDGVIISNDKGSFGRNTKTIVALDTNQVKSATENNGDFSKKENGILLSKAPQEGESSLDLPEETFARALQRKSQDKFNRFNVIKEFLEKEKGIKLSENADVYRAEERYHSKVTNQIEDFREKVRNPLIKKWADAGYTKEQIEEYLKQRHALEANIQNRKLTGEDTSNAYGITDEQAQEYLDKAPKELAKLADEVQEITDATQKLRLDNGIETQERVDAMRGAYKYYIPVRGDFEAQEAMRGSRGPGGRGFDVRYRPKRRLGHAARNEDVIGNIFQDYERAIVQVEKNRVAKSLALMAAEIQMPDLISIDQPIKRKVLRNEKAYGVLVKGALQDIFQTKEAAEQNKRFIIASQKNVTNSDITIAPITDQRLVYSASPMLDDNEVMAYMNGHEIRIQIKDDLLAQAYKNLGVEALPAILRVGRAMNGWMSKAYTGYYPEFILTNLRRDFTTGIINTTGEEGFLMAMKAVKNYPRSFASLLKYAATGVSNKWIDSYRANGGNTGAAYLSDLERLGEEVNGEYAAYQGVLKNLKAGDRANALRAAGRKAFNASLKYIEHLNQAGENAYRLAVFKAMIESGKSVNEAIHLAKNVTVNFNRKGELGGQFNAAYLFFNANLQGSSALAHALFKGKHKYQAWALAGGGLTALGYVVASALGGFDDPEKYDAIGDAVKSRNMIFAYGDGYVKIPVPYGAGFFYNVGRIFAEAQRKGEIGKLPYQLAAIALEEFSPFNVASSEEAEFNSQKVMYGLLPTVPRIPMEISGNFSTFTGREMYPEKEWYKSEPDNEKMWRGTKGTVYDVTAQLLVKAGIEISPETLKYLTRTATGGAGSFADSVVSAAMLKSQGADLEAREIPFLRKEYGEVTIQDMRQRHSKAKEEAVTAAEKFNAAMRKNDLVTAKQLMGDTGELIALKNYADKLSDTIKYLRDMQDSIKLSEDYTVAEKRLKIKELEKREEKFYNQYLDIFKTKKSEIKRRQEK